MSQPLVDSTLPAHSPTLRCSSAPFSPLSSPGKRSQAPVVPSPERFASAPKQLRSNLTKSVNAATNGAARLAPYSMDHHDAVLKAKLGSSSEVPHLAPQLPVKAMSAHVSSAQPERPVPTLALDHVASSGTTARTTAKVNATSDRPQQHRPPAPANQQPTPPGLAANYNVPIYPLSTYAHRDMLAADARGAALVSGHEHWVALVELGHLASQHHMSPYSMMKYGAQGELTF